MTQQQILIDGQWRDSQDSSGTFTAVNPATGEALGETYPVSGASDVEAALAAGYRAAQELRSTSPDTIADFLEAYADAIEARSDALVEMAHNETGLPAAPRLSLVELPRTTGQLRQAAHAARERSWCHPTIDTKNNIRSMLAPLGGPVVVLGPNNFPFAFNSLAGGDFAAAIAAGNSVIGKANTGHPGTTRLLAEAALETIEATGVPRALVQLLYRTPPEEGFRLVSDARTAATGFTGSKNAGLKLKAAAEKAHKPIYLELSSINPVILLPGALEERSAEIGGELATSCLMGAGQFCTSPGLVLLLESAQTDEFLNEFSQKLQATPPDVLLGQAGHKGLQQAVQELQDAGAQLVTGGQAVEEAGFRFQNTLLRATGDAFLQNPHALQTEAFGNASLAVVARDVAQLQEILSHLEGNLTGTIYSAQNGVDDALYAEIEPYLRAKVGRLLNDKMPTGVAVSPAMVHGGPPPATGHPGFTAVGIPASMVRFGALHCYDNVRPVRLPRELQDANPTGKIWRFIDGQWTQKSLS